MADTNVTLALGLATGGAAVLWAAIRNPEGGLPGALQRILNGQPAAGTPAPVRNVLDYAPALYTGTAAPVAGSAMSAADTPRPTSGGQAAIVDEAVKYLGIPYRWGGASPAGFDCSGLVQYVFGRLGVTMPRVSAAQARAGEPVTLATLMPGDLVAFGRPVHHIGIYAGDDRMIHAPHTGDVVRYARLSTYPGVPGLLTCRRVTVPSTTQPRPPISTVLA